MENSISILRQIEQTHHGLGVSILFGNISYLGNISPMFIGEKGTGKGTTISSIKTNLEPEKDMIIDNLTLTEMGNRSELQHCYNSKIVWRIKEWSTMNRWNRDLFMSIGAKIITDREYYHYIGMNKGGIPIVIDIKDTDLICFIGIQPLKMSRLMRENENWESLSSDRFIKWIMMNALRSSAVDSFPTYDMPEILDDKMEPEFNTNMMLTQKMLLNQISPERCPIFAKRLLTGYARFENTPIIGTQEELDFVRMFRHFIELYPKVIYSRDIAEETELAVGSLRLYTQIIKHNGISLDQLQDTFSVYNPKKKPLESGRPLENAKEMIRRHAELLLKKGLITYTENSPTHYYMDKSFEDYWDWYRDLVK